MNIFNNIIIVNDFLSNDQINNCMNAFNSSEHVEKFNDRLITRPQEVKGHEDIVKKCEDCIHLKVQWWQIVKCSVGSTFNKHKDTADKNTVASFIIFLNDNFQGGDFVVSDITYKTKKGSAIVFPSNFMFPHEVKLIEKGTRYSIVSWLM